MRVLPREFLLWGAVQVESAGAGCVGLLNWARRQVSDPAHPLITCVERYGYGHRERDTTMGRVRFIQSRSRTENQLHRAGLVVTRAVDEFGSGPGAQVQAPLGRCGRKVAANLGMQECD